MNEETGAPEFAVGIDLGTTHCAMAEARLTQPSVHLIAVAQLVAPGEVSERPLLPSFMFLAGDHELAGDARRLPWGTASHVVGTLAEQLGAQSPGRLVASAKSWVCHGGVNRRAPILPWNAPSGAPQVSPFAAQVAYLEHLRAAWEHKHAGRRLADQEVVVTVPASFDEGARELTSAAARSAGLGEVRLLEEPQAAFYDYFGAHRDELAAQLGDARLALVVDVGGGTTDLTLLQVRPADHPGGEPAIERIAVGGHLMLGGDNMDAALAMFALHKAGLERPQDATVWAGLVQSARAAKERLLGPAAEAQASIVLVSRGSRLIGGTRTIVVTRDEAREVLLEGFLPLSEPDEVAQRTARAGLTTLGLPYTTDTAIGRHVCAFLRRHVDAAARAGAQVCAGLPRPDRVLLNGGVFKAPSLVERLEAVLEHWYGEKIPLLPHTSLDTAVALGAVRFGLARRGIGEVIRGGTPRAYYIGIEGPQGEPEALCIAPRGMEEGTSCEVPDRVFDLLLDRPVAFPLYAYTGDRVDPVGTLLPLQGEGGGEELEALPWLETVVRFKGQAPDAGATVPVTLRATLSDIGALELFLVTVSLPPHRWRLEFSLHEQPSAAASTEGGSAAVAATPETLDEALAILRQRFGARDLAAIKSVRRDLEKVLGPRGQWNAVTCRALWDVLFECRTERTRSEAHELNWIRLCGWCLRPGFGAPGDETRVESLWALYPEGLAHRSKANWAEWWILWRRVAPGLSVEAQRALYASIRPFLWRDVPTPAGPHAHGPVEMMQLLAALERLSAATKLATGELLFERASKIGSYGPIGRVGARVPFHDPEAEVVDVAAAREWLRRLLELDWETAEGASWAAAAVARKRGDVALDIDDELRATVVERLRRAQAPADWIVMVERGGAFAGDASRVLGDSLPVGLRWSGNEGT